MTEKIVKIVKYSEQSECGHPGCVEQLGTCHICGYPAYGIYKLDSGIEIKLCPFHATITEKSL